ncbi:MAG: ribonuclease R, partial [Caulobacteraceae bacterium]
MRPRRARPRERDRPPQADGAPPVGVVDVVERDTDGELLVRRAGGEDQSLVRLAPGGSPSVGAPGVGDRLLVRFSLSENGDLEARLIKRLGQGGQRILGVVRKRAREVAVEPVDRRSRHGLRLSAVDGAKVEDGDLVLVRGGAAEAPIRQRGAGPARRPTEYGQLVEVVGREDDPRAASLIAIHSHGVPMGFTDTAESEARAAEPVGLGDREDLRHLPLVTID